MESAQVPYEEKITLIVSPVNRAEDLFALAHYLNRRFRWPYFHITSLVNGSAVFTASRSGWRFLQRELEESQEGPLAIITIEGDCVKLRVTSLAAIEQSNSSERTK